MNAREKIRPFVGFMEPATKYDVDTLLELIGDVKLEELASGDEIDPHKVAKEILKITKTAPQHSSLFWLFPL